MQHLRPPRVPIYNILRQLPNQTVLGTRKIRLLYKGT